MSDSSDFCPPGSQFYSCSFGETLQYEGCCWTNACDYSGCPGFITTDKSGHTIVGDVTTGSQNPSAAATSSDQSASDISTTSTQPASTKATSTSPADTPTSRIPTTLSSTALSSSKLSSTTTPLSASQVSSQALVAASPTTSGGSVPTPIQSHSKLGAIGGSVGGIVCLVIAAAVIWLLLRRRKSRKGVGEKPEKYRDDENMRLQENNADIIDNVLKKQRGKSIYSIFSIIL